MPGAGDGEWRNGPALPVGVILVGDEEGDRCAGGAPFHDAAEDLRLVLLDGHAAAGTGAALPPAKVGGNEFRRDRQARGQAVQDGGQGRTVGFAGG